MKHSPSEDVQQKDTASPSVEIAHLINGELISVRRLSARSEWRAALTAGGMVLALASGGALLVAAAQLAAHRVVYGPGYAALWILTGLGAALMAGRRARARAQAYVVGAGIDDDAFSPLPMTLVRRGPAGYELRVAEGMTGHIDGGRRPLLIEGLLRGQGGREARTTLPEGARAEIGLGNTAFVVTALAGQEQQAALPRGLVKKFVRRALLPMELAALGSVLCGIPAGARLGEADMKSAIPSDATPWEIEKLLRVEAQMQARTLHQCFDVLPLECQRPGYVGVGLALSREGEIRSRWIARSTFGRDCPVEQCMSDVISSWFFEPLPEPMKVVLPVQVLRTDKPLPLGAARAAANATRRTVAQNGAD